LLYAITTTFRCPVSRGGAVCSTGHISPCSICYSPVLLSRRLPYNVHFVDTIYPFDITISTSPFTGAISCYLPVHTGCYIVNRSSIFSTISAYHHSSTNKYITTFILCSFLLDILPFVVILLFYRYHSSFIPIHSHFIHSIPFILISFPHILHSSYHLFRFYRFFLCHSFITISLFYSIRYLTYNFHYSLGPACCSYRSFCLFVL